MQSYITFSSLALLSSSCTCQAQNISFKLSRNLHTLPQSWSYLYCDYTYIVFSKVTCTIAVCLLHKVYWPTLAYSYQSRGVRPSSLCHGWKYILKGV